MDDRKLVEVCWIQGGNYQCSVFVVDGMAAYGWCVTWDDGSGKRSRPVWGNAASAMLEGLQYAELGEE